MLDAASYMITVVYFWKISINWFYYFFFTIGANLIGLIGVYFIPESPRMLLNVGRNEEAMESLNEIAKFNKR